MKQDCSLEEPANRNVEGVFMRISPASFAVLAVLGAGLATTTRAVAQPQGRPVGPVTGEQVRTAIRTGVKYLLDEQNKQNGSWSEQIQNPGGITALCTLALLNSGVEPSHPQIQRALVHLRKFEPTRTYSVALQTMVLCAAQPLRDRVLIQRNVRWLEATQKEGGQWSYPAGGGDNSNSQFALLALHEAERLGAEVNPETWRRAAKYWRDSQESDGSWSYRPEFDTGLGSMTCAGIGASVICSGRVSNLNASVQNGQVQCCQLNDEDDSIELGLTWLARNFSVQRNPGRRGMQNVWHYYYLYGLERVGRLTARRFIGEYDWYREGAEFLINQQDLFSHHWVGQHHGENNPHIATSFALLFLSKGRRPLLMAKLQHGPEEDWNNHRNDVANLTARAEQLWGLDLTWQVIDPSGASVEDLLQAPVLFLSGNRKPLLSDMDQTMRDYLDRGGFLFAEACCLDGSQFEAGFRQFMERVFPEPEYRLRRAGPEHPIWRVEELVRPDSPYVSRLWTVEYGCRTCVVFSEVDLSCHWELSGQRRLRNLPATAKQRIDDANAVGMNVLAYATNREPKGKETAFTGTGDLAQLEAMGSRGTIQIAKLQHGGGCNDAPGALVNLLRSAAGGELKLSVSTAEVPIRPGDKNLFRYHMAFMHGRHDFRFTPEERAQLRRYLENGGTLLADSICSSKEFATAFRREIGAIFPETSLQRVRSTHPLLSDAGGGFNIRRVERRDPVGQQPGKTMRTSTREVEPELEGVELDGRLAIIFSPYDISCALEQHESLQCRGYTREDAARIGLNVLMYSLSPDAAAAQP